MRATTNMKRLVRLLACALFVFTAGHAQTLPGSAFPVSAENFAGDLLLTSAGARSSFAVAWRGRTTDLRIRFLRADGVPLTDSVSLANAEDASLASDGHGFMLVYSTLADIRAIRYSGAGERLDANPLIISMTPSAYPKVDVAATGRGTYRIFWSEPSVIRTRVVTGSELSEPTLVIPYADELANIEAQRHPITGIWLIAPTTVIPCRITCAQSYETTLYGSLLSGSAVDLGTLDGERHVPTLEVFRDGRIVLAGDVAAIAWQFEGSELVEQWLVVFDELSCATSIVEHGSDTLIFTSGCSTNALFLQPVSARGALGVNLPVDAIVSGGFPIATFRTLRGAGILYVGDPVNPTLMGRVMPSLFRRGVTRP